jgi:hypothetical protein
MKIRDSFFLFVELVSFDEFYSKGVDSKSSNICPPCGKILRMNYRTIRIILHNIVVTIQFNNSYNLEKYHLLGYDAV